MKKDSIIIIALSVGIVLAVGVTASVLLNSSKKAAVSTGITTIESTSTPAAQSVTTTAATTSVKETTQVTTTASETTKVTQKATSAPTVTPTVSPSPTPAVLLDDGSYNAYVTAVTTKAPDANTQGMITVRIAKIYTGAEAIAQAKADGHADYIEKDENGVEYIPDDYYISDTNYSEVMLPVTKTASIRVIPSSGPDSTSDDYCVDAALKDLANNTVGYVRFATITVVGGQVNKVVEFYLP
jgi:flagellar basal body-associated protein FliL